MLNAVLAINRVYLPHRLAKWQREVLAGLARGRPPGWLSDCTP